MSKAFIYGIVCLLMLGAVRALPASARSAETKTGPKVAETPNRKSGSALGGSGSVSGQLDKDRTFKGALSVKPGFMDTYAVFKKRIEDEHGFSFGIDYNALFQAANESLGEDTAAGGVFRTYGRWTLVGRDSVNTK